jgi:excisionase family DNA binding protein
MQGLMKPTEVAHQLGVSRSWLYDAAKAGRIPSIRIGGEDGPLRFVSKDIEHWIDDARAAWHPGRPAVATRSPVAAGREGQRSRPTALGEQQCFLD